MSSDPIRAALERLLNAADVVVDIYESIGMDVMDDAIAAARAALAAAPEGRGRVMRRVSACSSTPTTQKKALSCIPAGGRLNQQL